MTWRDVQHVLVLAGSPVDVAGGTWIQNGAGVMFSRYYGFGLLRADAIMAVAEAYVALASQLDEAYTTYTSSTLTTSATVPAYSSISVSYVVPPAGSGHMAPLRIEHVGVTIRLVHSQRGAVQLWLTSPNGTTVLLASARTNDRSTEGFQNIEFYSVATWGEDPAGTWTLRVENQAAVAGTLNSWELVLMGQAYKHDSSSQRENIIIGVAAGVTCVVGFGAAFAYRIRRKRAAAAAPGASTATASGDGAVTTRTGSADDDAESEAMLKAFSDEGEDVEAHDLAGAPGGGKSAGGDSGARQGWWLWRPKETSPEDDDLEARVAKSRARRLKTLQEQNDSSASGMALLARVGAVGQRRGGDGDGDGDDDAYLSDTDGLPQPVSLKDDDNGDEL